MGEKGGDDGIGEGEAAEGTAAAVIGGEGELVSDVDGPAGAAEGGAVGGAGSVVVVGGFANDAFWGCGWGECGLGFWLVEEGHGFFWG